MTRIPISDGDGNGNEGTDGPSRDESRFLSYTVDAISQNARKKSERSMTDTRSYLGDLMIGVNLTEEDLAVLLDRYEAGES